MVVKIVKEEPDPTVLKEVICPKCGVTLSYVPMDVVGDYYSSDYLGGREYYNSIECIKCSHRVRL